VDQAYLQDTGASIWVGNTIDMARFGLFTLRGIPGSGDGPELIFALPEKPERLLREAARVIIFPDEWRMA
jgi:hypothetical protein